MSTCNNVVDFIKDLTPMVVKSDWKVNVRILYVWTTTFGVHSSVEALLMDEEGSKIQTSVYKKLMWKFQKFLEDGEGETRKITNFDLAENTGNYKSNKHPYKIAFMRNTRVEPCTNESIPKHSFEFVPFGYIHDMNPIKNDYLIDVIGEIVRGTKMKDEMGSKILDIELEDLEKNILQVTLWNELAVKVRNYMDNKTGRVLFALKFGIIKEFNGKRYVQNAKFGGKVFLDLDIDVFNSYRQRMLDVDGLGNDSNRITQMDSQTTITKRDAFLNGFQRMNLSEIALVEENTTCVVLATIACIKQNGDWSYIGCKKCHRRAERATSYQSSGKHDTDSEISQDTGVYTGFKCAQCKNERAAVSPMFKINVRVIDSTGCATFLLWDNDVKHLIHRTTLELRRKQAEMKTELTVLNLASKMQSTQEDDAYPIEINAMLNKQCLFKLDISSSNNPNLPSDIKVAKMTNDPDIISEFLAIHRQDMGGGSDMTTTPARNNTRVTEESKNIASQSGDSEQVNEELVTTASSPISKAKMKNLDTPPSTVQSANTRKRKMVLDDDE
ncbi:OLC1v1035641C1 [Oldenlandia corymbosa var. corymbosa]|uniref:OLC1v1035641C1 n=1 Tax=Oldenlandia corymbosa var. corymbosa TaxID=529605 RepID=A0AAV1CTG6_OLDCO|nr:OLC1v1035641C1 [Oldenlandia corymbosa var. corymbosa]